MGLHSLDITEYVEYDPAVAKNRVPIITANGVIEVPRIRVKAIEFRGLHVEDVELIFWKDR